MQLGDTVVRTARGILDAVFTVTGRAVQTAVNFLFIEGLPVVVTDADVGVQPVGELGGQTQLGDNRLFVAVIVLVGDTVQHGVRHGEVGSPVPFLSHGVDIVLVVPFQVRVTVDVVRGHVTRYRTAVPTVVVIGVGRVGV